MFSVALIGVDGAGKTTIARMLAESSPIPLKYVYMGTSIESSNVALPTSRLILYLKKRAYRKSMNAAGQSTPDSISTHDLEYRAVERGRLSVTARLFYRLAEEWYRQAVAWSYQMRGQVVLFDRHFVYEYTPRSSETQARTSRLSDRIHLWILDHLYPDPDLTLFLDAPPDLLHQRKQEWPPEHLERHRQAILDQGRDMPNFVLIDASQPVEQVYADALHRLLQYAALESGDRSGKAKEGN